MDQIDVSFSLGNESKIKSLSDPIEGRFYISEDTKKIFVSKNGQNIKIGDIEDISTEEERLSLFAPLQKFYLVEETGSLWRYSYEFGWVEYLNRCKCPDMITRKRLDFIKWVGESTPGEQNIVDDIGAQISTYYNDHGMSAEGVPIPNTGMGIRCAIIPLPTRYENLSLLGGPAFNGHRFTIACFDKDQKYIGWLEWQTYTYPITQSKLPTGTQYIGVTWYKTDGTNPKYEIKYDSPEIISYYPVDEEIRVLAENVIGLEPCTCSGNNSNEPYNYQGKKMAVLGCSLTQAEGFIAWHSHVKDALGLSTVYNHGLGWSIVGENTTPYFNPNTVVADERRPMLRRASDMPDDADIIAVLPGTGEMVWNLPMGTINDSLTNGDGLSLTFYSSLKRLALILKNKYPGKRIMFLTTMNQSSKSSLEHQAAVKAVANMYNIHICDTNTPLLNFYTMSPAERALTTTDGIHMTNEGHRRLGEAVISALFNIDKVTVSAISEINAAVELPSNEVQYNTYELNLVSGCPYKDDGNKARVSVFGDICAISTPELTSMSGAVTLTKLYQLPDNMKPRTTVKHYYTMCDKASNQATAAIVVDTDGYVSIQKTSSYMVPYFQFSFSWVK